MQMACLPAWKAVAVFSTGYNLPAAAIKYCWIINKNMEKNKNNGNPVEEPETDQNADPLENNDQPGKEADPTESLSRELDIQKDKYLRLVAEFDNFKRRGAKERMELIQTAGKEVITSLLDVLDDCDRAEKQLNEEGFNDEQVKTGVMLVFNKLRSTLQAKGLKPMESINTEFDVHKHEAIAEVPVPDEDKKGKVIDEIVKGYYLNEKLIRFAKVIVGK
jgi:molecular chaperone GrpE